MTIDNRIYNYVVNEEVHQDRSVIIQEGGHGNWAYLVLEGTVKLKKKTPKGLVTTETLGPGDIFGESAMFQESSSKRSISAVADGPVMLGLLDANRIIEERGKGPFRKPGDLRRVEGIGEKTVERLRPFLTFD